MTPLTPEEAQKAAGVFGWAVSLARSYARRHGLENHADELESEALYEACLTARGHDPARGAMTTLLRRGAWWRMTRFRVRHLGRRPEPTPELGDVTREPGRAPVEWDEAGWGLYLAPLTGRQREAVLGRFRDGLTFPELGERLGVSTQAAHRRVASALEILRGHHRGERA